MTDLGLAAGVTGSAIGAPFEVAQPARMSFENLRVYKAAELLIVLVEHLMESTPRISRSDADRPTSTVGRAADVRTSIRASTSTATSELSGVTRPR